MNNRKLIIIKFMLCACLSMSQTLLADESEATAVSVQLEQQEGGGDAEAIAKKLANPVSALIKIPIQLNYDSNIGTDDKGGRWTINFQPVVPFVLNDDWNLISRTILPVVRQDDIAPGIGNQSGLGDTLQSFFFTPKKPTKSGWILGAGPVFLLPTGTDDLLTSDKWGIGPTAVALKQQGPWTYGGLTNHVWSVAGDDDRSDISTTFLQPFITYTTKSAISFTTTTESTYDWKSEQWSVPIIVTASKVTRIGNQMISFGGGLRYWAESTESGPEGWGARLILTFMLPK